MIGFFNAANGVLTIFAVPYVSGVLQALLAQAVIPATVVLSLVYLRMKFTAWQYAGALTIIVGVVVELVPAFTSSSGTSSTQGTVPGWAVAFALAQVPQVCGAAGGAGSLLFSASAVTRASPPSSISHDTTQHR